MRSDGGGRPGAAVDPETEEARSGRCASIPSPAALNVSEGLPTPLYHLRARRRSGARPRSRRGTGPRGIPGGSFRINRLRGEGEAICPICPSLSEKLSELRRRTSRRKAGRWSIQRGSGGRAACVAVHSAAGLTQPRSGDLALSSNGGSAMTALRTSAIAACDTALVSLAVVSVVATSAVLTFVVLDALLGF